MATAEQCRDALESVARRITEIDPAERERHLLERTVSCRVPDLGVEFRTTLSREGVGEITRVTGSSEPAQLRFTVVSDDLVALAEDRLDLARAWLSGRLKIEASVMDLLRLRRIL